LKPSAPSGHESKGVLSDLHALAASEQRFAPPEALDFDTCYASHAKTVHRWVRRLGGRDVDVDDLVQEVFCVVHRRLPEWDGQGKLSTWIFRITHHVVRNWNRKRRWSRWLRLDFDEPALEPSDEAPSALDRLDSRQTVADVHRVLDDLPERHRTVLVLFELEELSTHEIADMLETKVGTVRVWLHRARAEFLKQHQARERAGLSLEDRGR
jgi:RNA polymerase sigma-70 factor, ECF subfamily